MPVKIRQAFDRQNVIGNLELFLIFLDRLQIFPFCFLAFQVHLRHCKIFKRVSSRRGVVLSIGLLVTVHLVPGHRDDLVIVRSQQQYHRPLHANKPCPLSLACSLVFCPLYRCILTRTPKNVDEEKMQVWFSMISILERTHPCFLLRQQVVQVRGPEVGQAPATRR